MNQMIERDPSLLAMSDLMITHIREYYQLRFDTTAEQTPAALNCAYLIGGGPSLFVDFFLEQLPEQSSGCYCTCAGMHIYVRRLEPNQQPEPKVIQQIVDNCQREFARTDSPTSHVRRLRIRFDFLSSAAVSRDIRKVFLAPLLEQYPGKFTYPELRDYDGNLEINDLNPHPTGIQTAWEAEFFFDQPVLAETLAATVYRSFGAELKLGVLTHLPKKVIDDVGCQFALATRYF